MRTVEGEDRVATDARGRILEAFDRTYVPIAVHGLPRMLLEGGGTFCFRARADAATPGGLVLEGVSERYAAMAMIGVLRQRALGRAVDLDPAPVIDSLVRWTQEAGPDDVGLVLQVLLLAGDAHAEEVLAKLVARREAILAPTFASSMALGCLLHGLADALGAGIATPAARGLTAEVTGRLLDNQDAATGLFAFGGPLRRRNLHRARVDARLGSFASQVYPTLALAALARQSGDEAALAATLRCADRIAALQGDAGQWWWVYHRGRAEPAVRYPVYSVHQDAMGPMMLAAAALADGATQRYDAAIERSLGWFDDRPELPDARLVDAERGVVWRAVQRDDPASTGRLGLAPGELRRMGRSAWFGTVDRRPFERGFVCRECRPYHLGWILFADALFRELEAARGTV